MPWQAGNTPRLLLLSLALVLGYAPWAHATDGPCRDGLGQTIDRGVFQPGAAKAGSPSDLKEMKAVVVVFLSFDCPVSTSYLQPLADLSREYAGRGVAFLGITSGDEEEAGATRKQVEGYQVPFPVFRDTQGTVAHAFRPRVTPEAFVLDGQSVLRYRGRIDDTFYARLKKNARVTHQDLRQALDEVLAGKPVSTPATGAVGCPVSRAGPARAATGKITYYRDVLPIVQNHCQICHRPGEVGPFSLMTYRQAVTWAGDIKEYTGNRKMPPWKPVDGPAFHDERQLSARDIATLAAWVDGGTPAGDPREAPPAPQFSEGWQLGPPDLVLTPDQDFHVGPSGPDEFRCYVLSTHLPEDRYVTAVEFRPGNRRVVHHSLVFVDNRGQARRLEQAQQARKSAGQDFGPGYSSSMGIGFLPAGGLGGWAPGQRARSLPDGTGYFLPKGADVVVQVHYHRDGRAETDRPTLGLYLAKKPVARAFQSLVIPGRFLYIPIGDPHYRVQGSIWVRQDCDLHSVMPHMHMLGREVRITMTPPDGPPRVLVAINDWEYNWQETYFFRDPIHVPAGTRFDIEAFYDNTSKNPSNPNKPPLPVFFGQETTNEMLFGFVGVTSDKPGRIRFDRKGPDGKGQTAKTS